jgi:hypothetical protein
LADNHNGDEAIIRSGGLVASALLRFVQSGSLDCRCDARIHAGAAGVRTCQRGASMVPLRKDRARSRPRDQD